MINDAVVLRDKIYLDYNEKVTAYVRSRITDPYAAEDVVSEVFLKVYQKLAWICAKASFISFCSSEGMLAKPKVTREYFVLITEFVKE